MPRPLPSSPFRRFNSSPEVILAVGVADPADRRRQVIVLTGRGEHTLAALCGPAARARALSAFDAAEAQDFLDLRATLVAHFNRQTRAPIHPGPAAALERA